MVDVILLERVEKLGQMGQVVKVKPGFARNYLLPQKKAMRATKENMAYFETQRAQLEAHNLERKSEAGEVGGKLEGLTVVLIRQAGERPGLPSRSARSCSTARSRRSACIGSGSCCTPRLASSSPSMWRNPRKPLSCKPPASTRWRSAMPKSGSPCHPSPKRRPDQKPLPQCD